MLTPGDIAECMAGELGLIQRISHRDGHPLYKGIHISRARFGEPWESVLPTYKGTIFHLEEYNQCE